jgi:glycosyltransferase involved in cell wall biosynthesis/peptidoglycan/xylan/chitin deacetylase (PgdA/CDA1 family)
MGETNRVQNALTGFLGTIEPVRSVARRICRSGATIFLFHRVLPQGMECCVPEMATSQEAFTEFLDWISEEYRILPLDVLVRRGGKPSDRKRPDCAITFDDGWLDNFAHAFPVLQKRNLPATIFIPIRFIGTNRRFWQDKLWLSLREIEKRKASQNPVEEVAVRFPWFPPQPLPLACYGALRQVLMTRPSEEAEDFVQCLAESARVEALFSDRAFLDWNEVRQMQTCEISFGSHALHHSLLTNMAPALAVEEIRNSRRELGEQLGVAIPHFAYPWGAANSFTEEAVKGSGFDYAFTTQTGVVNSKTDPWLTPRIAISNLGLTSGTARLEPERARLSFAKNIAVSLPSRRKRDTSPSPKRIKIAFVIDEIDSWEGGTEGHVRMLVRSLDREYFAPEIFCILSNPRVPRETYPCPVQFVCPSPGERTSPPRRLLRLMKLLRAFKPDVVQTFFFEGTVYGILAAGLARAPWVVGTTRNMSDWKRGNHLLLLRLIETIADRWVCNSRTVWGYRSGIGRMKASRIEILPNSTDLSRFTPATRDERVEIRRRLSLDCDALVIISVAHLRRVKDLSTLIEAARLLHRECPDARVLLLGEGPEEGELKRQARQADLKDAIQFLGCQTDVRSYLAAADIGVLTSLSEGSSNSLLEYMAMGLPAVVSDIPANRDLVSGVFFPVGNSGELAKTIVDLFHDTRLRLKLSSEYRDRANQHSVDSFHTRAQAFYSELIREV